MKKIVVFDVDDILWSLNKRAALLANVPYNKLVTFNLSENTLLNKEEKDRIINVYNSNELFKVMNFYNGIERLNTLNAEVHISSNVFKEIPAQQKMNHLLKVLTIPIENIHLNMVTDPYKKTLPEGTYIFVDDSPYNIANSTATHNIMLKKAWNTSELANKIMGDVPRVQFDTLNEIIDYIEQILK